jgi:O-antigen/teichoic acid export membrane protein
VKAHLFRLSGQTIVYGLAGASLSLVGLFTLPVFTRVFTPAQYGALEIVVVASGALAVAVDLGLGLAAQRSYYDHPPEAVDGRRAVLSTAVATSLVSACAVAALVVVFARPLADALLGHRSYGPLVAVTGLALPAGVLAQLTREVLRLTMRPWPYLVSCLLATAAGGALGIALVTVGSAELKEVQIGALVGAGLSGVYGLAVVRGDLGLVFSRRELGVMLRYGLPLVPAGLAFWGLLLIDRFILQRLEGLGEVGVYGVANRTASIELLAALAFATAWAPFMLALHADDPEEERRVRARVLLYVSVLFGLISLALGLFAREAIDLVAPGYEAGADSVGLLALGLMFQGVGAVAASGITIARRTSALALYTVFALVVDIVLCFALIPLAGQVGAAIATLAAFALLAALQYRRAQQLDPAPFELRRVLLAIAICAIPLPLGAVLDPGPASELVKLAAIALAIAALVVTGVLGEMERDWVRGLVRRSRGSD